MQNIITEVQIKSLEDKIYTAIMAVEVISEDGQDILSLGMGEMGEAREAAQLVVSEWMEENGVVIEYTKIKVHFNGEMYEAKGMEGNLLRSFRLYDDLLQWVKNKEYEIDGIITGIEF